MTFPKIDLSNLSAFQNRVDLIKATAQQIIKDFSAFGYEINFSGNTETAYQELTDQIMLLIQEMINRNYQGLMSVLYRIDVSEREINNKIMNCEPHEFAEKITEMVVEREFKKVITRWYFSNQENEDGNLPQKQ